jgi:hypothetical protein
LPISAVNSVVPEPERFEQFTLRASGVSDEIALFRRFGKVRAERQVSGCPGKIKCVLVPGEGDGVGSVWLEAKAGRFEAPTLKPTGVSTKGGQGGVGHRFHAALKPVADGEELQERDGGEWRIDEGVEGNDGGRAAGRARDVPHCRGPSGEAEGDTTADGGGDCDIVGRAFAPDHVDPRHEAVGRIMGARTDVRQVEVGMGVHETGKEDRIRKAK